MSALFTNHTSGSFALEIRPSVFQVRSNICASLSVCQKSFVTLKESRIANTRVHHWLLSKYPWNGDRLDQDLKANDIVYLASVKWAENHFTKFNFLTSLWVQSCCVFTCTWCAVLPIDVDRGEDQNNSPESVRGRWHRAVSRGQNQDRLLPSTSELTAAAVTDSSHFSFLCDKVTQWLFLFCLLPGLWFIAHLHGQDPSVPVPHAWQEGGTHWICFTNQRCPCQHRSWLHLPISGNGTWSAAG